MYSSMIISFFQACVQGLIVSIFFSSFLPYRKVVDTWYKKAFAIVGAALFNTLLTRAFEWYAIQVQTDFVMGMNIFTALACYFLVCQLLFSGALLRKVFLTLICFVFFASFETLAIMLANPLWSEERFMLMGQKDGLLYHVSYCLNYLMALITALLVKRYRKGGELVGGNHMFILQCLLPLCSFAFLYTYSVLEWEHFDMTIFALIFGFIALVNAYGYWFFSQQQKNYKEKYENLLIAQDYQHREAYYQELENHQKTVRLIRHDLKNQLLAVSGTNGAVETKELLEILEQAPPRLTENIGLNQLIISKMRIAQEHDIKCDFNIQIPEFMEFRQMDIGALIGNIMDNAIEACLRCKENRFFQMELIYQGHALMIRSNNSVEGNVDTTKTTKKNTESHGFGMRSIKNIVEKYNGTITWKTDGGRFELDALIWEPKCKK